MTNKIIVGVLVAVVIGLIYFGSARKETIITGFSSSTPSVISAVSTSTAK